MKSKGMIISVLILVGAGILFYLNPGQFFTKTILRISGEYTTPKNETDSGILLKVKNENLYYDRLYRLTDMKAFKDFQEKKITTVPFVQIYNRDKKMLTIASGSECLWTLMDFFSKKDSFNLIAGDSLMYPFVINRLEPIDIKTNKDTFAYYILAGWANFIPKLSSRLFERTNELKKTLNEKVCFSYINLDAQEGWEVEMDDK